MENLSSFKLQIIKYALIIAGIFEVISLAVLKFNLKFLCGLLIGTGTAIISFIILVYMSEKVLASGEKWMASVGYLIRLPLYGAALFVCIKIDSMALVGCLLGFITTMIAIIYIHGIKAKFSTGRKVRPEVMAEFEREDREKEEKF